MAMLAFVLPILLLSATTASVLFLRSRGSATRAFLHLTLVGVLGLVLYRAGTSPLLTDASVPMGPDGHWLRAVGIVWWFAAASLTALVVDTVLGHDEASREARITSDLVCAAIYIAAALVVLNFVLLLPVNGLVATSGVIAVVIGLALQNTLSDVFSGIAVGIEHPFGVGHRITLGDGVEGVVSQVNWRSIRILTDGGDIASIPNSVVAKAQIVNRSVPTERRSARVQLLRPSTEPPERILRMLDQSALLCPEVLPAPRPVATLTRLGDRTNSFALDFFVSATSKIGSAKSGLLLHVDRQLRYSRLLDEDVADKAGSAGPSGTKEALVGQIALFGPLSAEARADLAGSMTRQVLETGDVLFSEGADDDRLYVIASGVLEITRSTGDDATTLIGRIGSGEYIGEISMLTGAPHAANATAISRSVVYELRRDALSPLIEKDEALALAFERSVKRGLCLVERAVASQVGESPTDPGALLNGIRRLFGHGSARR